MGKFFIGLVLGIIIGDIFALVMLSLISVGKNDDLENSGGGTTPNSDLNAEKRSDSGDKNGVC